MSLTRSVDGRRPGLGQTLAVITAIAIRIKREDLAGTPEPAQDRPADTEPALAQARS